MTKPTEISQYATKDEQLKLLERCADLAHASSVLGRLDEELRNHGFAGSTNNARTVYLSTFTRMFQNPVSLVIKGNSGSGKSFSMHSGLRYVPSDAYHEVHGMSEKALLHSSHINLKHRFLVIQEAAGFAKDGWVFLRQMLTEGKLDYLSVGHNKEGHEGKVLQTVEGPMGVMMTTTANALHAEDETRLLSLYVDQSPEQIRRALMKNMHAGPTKPSEDTLAKWHAFHQYVCNGMQEVSIPFLETLLSRLPTSHSRVLRDAPKVLSLIRAHALIHQLSRRKEGNKIVATLDDYAMVYDLVSEPLAFGLRESVPHHIADVVKAALKLHRQHERPLTQVEIAKHLGRDQSVVSRSLSTATREGFLFNEVTGQGRPYGYVPGERELPSNQVLPTPMEMRASTRLKAELAEPNFGLPPKH